MVMINGELRRVIDKSVNIIVVVDICLDVFSSIVFLNLNDLRECVRVVCYE